MRLTLEPKTIYNLICGAVIFASNVRAERGYINQYVEPSYLPLTLEPKMIHNLKCGPVIFASNIRAKGRYKNLICVAVIFAS